MEYYAVDNQGEVCVKGTNVFRGYYKDPERTAEAIDEYGWHHTGDVGMWLPNGTLKIIDRRKHIFKLSQGEYIVPEKIEVIYVKCQYVLQCFVYGESLKVIILLLIDNLFHEITTMLTHIFRAVSLQSSFRMLMC